MSTTDIHTPPDPNALLAGSGGRSAKFENPGDKVSGEIIEVASAQQTTIDGAPKFWDDGKPMWQVVVTLQTDQHDDADDDGIRKVYLKGSSKYASSQQAVRDALKAHGPGTQLVAGGRLDIAYTGNGVADKPGRSAPKLYVARYTPPAAGADLDAIFDQQAPQQAAPQPQAAPTPQPAGSPWP